MREASQTSFVEALENRVRAEVLDPCTSCGACVEVCPMTGPAGIDARGSAAIVDGVLDLLRGGEGAEVSRRWAEVCTGSGSCIPACPEGVNPRFMLAMARFAAKGEAGPEQVHSDARRSFGEMSRAVRTLSSLQLPPELLARVSPGAGQKDPSAEPEVVFYTGCNVLRTPHIALICLEVLDALGVEYEVMGGPSHCCGIFHFMAGDGETSGKVATNTIERLGAAGTAEVLSWCPSCQVELGEIALPSYSQSRGPAPFDLTPFYVWLARRLDDLRPLMVNRVEKRVALVERPALPEVVAATRRLVEAIPGAKYVELEVPRVGIMANYLAVLKDFKGKLRESEFQAAAAAGVTTLATVYHACHRDICHFEDDVSFEIVNLMGLIGESIGVHADDSYKRLKMMADVDAIVAECRELIEVHDLDLDVVRDQIATHMVGESRA
jgi:Fe-S oxidoreductase